MKKYSKNVMKALDGSIEKWRGIAAGTGIDKGSLNCPLCIMFNETEGSALCRGCPISGDTGFIGCVGTPYSEEWCNVFKGVMPSDGWRADTPRRKKAAREMLKYLADLRARLSRKRETKRKEGKKDEQTY